MTDAVKPTIGRIVYFYDPKIPERIGLREGYSGRCEGPYAAIVTNDIGDGLELSVFYPGNTPFSVKAVAEKTEPPSADKPYWAWPTPLDKARAVKAAG